MVDRTGAVILGLLAIAIVILVLVVVPFLFPGFISFLQWHGDSYAPAMRVPNSTISVYPNQVVIAGSFAYSYTAGNSMLPTICAGSTVLYARGVAQTSLRVGDVVFFNATWHQATPVLHRIIEIGSDANGWYAITKGDNNLMSDPDRLRYDHIQYVVVGVLY